MFRRQKRSASPEHPGQQPKLPKSELQGQPQPQPGTSTAGTDTRNPQKGSQEAHDNILRLFDSVPKKHRIPVDEIDDGEILSEFKIYESFNEEVSEDDSIFSEHFELYEDNDKAPWPEFLTGDILSPDDDDKSTNSNLSRKPNVPLTQEEPRVPAAPAAQDAPINNSPLQLQPPNSGRSWGSDNTIDSSGALTFSEPTGLQLSPDENDPFSFFQLIITDELLGYIAEQTNAQAEYMFLEGQRFLPKGRISQWRELTVPELKIFLGLLFLSGMVSQARVEDHWNTTKHYEGLFRTPTFPENMSRDRFLMILWCLHFARNPKDGEEEPVDKLHKIRHMIDYFNNRMAQVYSAGRELGIDESNVLWRGRLAFRQYNPRKRHKYGMKLYSLTEPNGLVLRLILYAGSADVDDGGQGHATKVVKKLMTGLTGQGRALFMDNYYNSVELASYLKHNLTYVTGTLRANRRENPPSVTGAKLKKGEVAQQFSSDGICVLKWKDNREVLMISTEFDGEIVSVLNSRGVEKEKPGAVAMYNRNMQGTDQSDQLLAFYPSERKTIKWYRKMGIHLLHILTNNAYLLYRKYGDKHVTTQYDFRASVILKLLNTDFPKPSSRPIVPTPPRFRGRVVTNHFPKSNGKSEGGKHTQRRRCRMCLQNGIKEKRSAWFCPECPDQPTLCIETCFQKWHRNILLPENPQ